MKRLSFFDKIVFFLNGTLVIVLLLACVVQYVPTDEFPFISILSLGVPVLILANLLFLCYWLLRWKRLLLLPLGVLIVGYFLAGSFIGFGFTTRDQPSSEDLKVMTFNVRYFNRAERIKRPDVFGETLDFILREDPDILCIQEMDYLKGDMFKEYYPYQYLSYLENNDRIVMGILSKHPIIKANTLDWPNSKNNGSYADILYQKDTIRVYNLHMESLQITASKRSMAREARPRLYKKLSRIFKKQSLEAKWFSRHRDSVDYNTIVCGDFNNTQFSNSYRIARGNMNDTFLEKGRGLGTTFSFLGLPYRIDYILADPIFEVRTHTNYKVDLSDHFPVMASFGLKKK